MRTKKILWVFLSVLMIVSMFSINVSADLAQNTPDGATAVLYCVDENGNILDTIYYWGTSWSSFTETAPSITGYTPSQSTIKITHGLLFTKEYTITYTKNSYTLTIYYKYANGGTASSTYTASVKYGASYSVSSPSISGYTPSEYSVYGTMRSTNISKTVTYTAKVKSYTVTVNYKYSSGGTAATTKTQTGNEGTSYSITSPTISGYVASDSVVSGTFSNNETITVTYTPVTPKYTLIIKYVYSTGGTASSTHTETLESGSKYNVVSPIIDGYAPDKVKVSGNLTSNTTITVMYTKNQVVETPTTYTLTIYYKYDTGGTASSTYTNTLTKGSSYSVKSPSISGYTADSSYVSGVLNADRTVTVYYSKNVVVEPEPSVETYTLKIYYKYSSGGTASTTYTTTLDEGSSYSVKSPTISGYTPDSTYVSGTIYSNTTVTVYYTKIQTTTYYDLTIYYKYEDGTTASSTYSTTLSKGSSYSVASPSISGYTADQTIVSGTLNANKTVTVYYEKNTPVQYTLTIYYKFEDGSPAAMTHSKTMDTGSTYSVTSPTIEDYVADKTVVRGTLSGNKSVTVTYSARTPDVSFEADGGTGDYTAGTTVISSFTMKNGAYNIKPFMNCDIAFRAYYIENGTQKTVATDTWDNFVIPKNEEGLVYFMWDVPESLVGKTVYCEISYGSQTMSFSKTVKAKAESQTPNTRYETETPSDYTSQTVSASNRISDTWSVWVYENGAYSEKTQSLTVTAKAIIKPDDDAWSAEYIEGKWVMKSGYGYTLSASIVYSTTGDADYIKSQCASAYLPEYMYTSRQNEYCTLDLVGEEYQFVQNIDTIDSERIVFMPVWYPDGEYIVKVTITDIWTPNGKLSVSALSNTINVKGSVFDDWFVGS